MPCKYDEHLVCNRWLHIGLLDNILQFQSSSYLHQISFPTQLQFLHKLCQNYFSYNFQWSYYFICNAIYLHWLTFKIVKNPFTNKIYYHQQHPKTLSLFNCFHNEDHKGVHKGCLAKPCETRHKVLFMFVKIKYSIYYFQ